MRAGALQILSKAPARKLKNGARSEKAPAGVFQPSALRPGKSWPASVR